MGGTLVPKKGGSTWKTSVVLITVLSSKSGGQRSSASSFGATVFAQGSVGSVPIDPSAMSVKPSQSESPGGTSQSPKVAMVGHGSQTSQAYKKF